MTPSIHRNLKAVALFLTVSSLVGLPHQAAADCYGRTIGGTDEQGSLCQFADESSATLPRQQGDSRYISSDDLFTREERIKMMREVVTQQAQGADDRTGSLVARGTTPRRMLNPYRRPQLWR